MPSTHRPPGLALALLATLASCTLAACAVGGEDSTSTSAGTTSGTTSTKVTLVTHDSFVMSKPLKRQFEKESGYTLELVPNGDAGELTNKLVLTKDNPLGDAVFGIDNTFATRAVDEGVLAPYTPEGLPSSAADYALDDAAAARVLTPVDWGDVCVNVDDVWFAEHDLAPPVTFDDLLDPAYRDLFVTPAASTSSPGFAFLLATIGTYGEDGWQDYWKALVANGARVVSGWSDAYEVDFTAGGGNGDRPIVVSYNSSPPFTIPDGAQRPTTSALLDTCFRQVEYAGVLDGADNVAGAEALLDFLETTAFQEALPESMYVFPVDSAATLPPLWARWAEPSPDPVQVDPARVASSRTDWIREWSDLTSG